MLYIKKKKKKNAPQQHVRINIDTDSVFKPLRGVKDRKGPDKISGRLLKNCAEPLAEIFPYLFTEYLVYGRTVIAPVPKVTVPKSLNDFWPVAPISLVMKTFEKN